MEYVIPYPMPSSIVLALSSTGGNDEHDDAAESVYQDQQSSYYVTEAMVPINVPINELPPKPKTQNNKMPRKIHKGLKKISNDTVLHTDVCSYNEGSNGDSYGTKNVSNHYDGVFATNSDDNHHRNEPIQSKKSHHIYF